MLSYFLVGYSQIVRPVESLPFVSPQVSMNSALEKRALAACAACFETYGPLRPVLVRRKISPVDFLETIERCLNVIKKIIAPPVLIAS